MFRPKPAAAPDRARRSRPRALRGLVALAASVVATATVLATAPAASAALTGAGTIEPTTSFPAWYKDANGVALQLCLDGLPNCLASFDELVTTHNDGGDGEAFYYAADAELGPITVHNALEAAYAADGPDQEVTFMRSQVSAPRGGLTANGTYTITDPYGVLTCKASATGTIPNNGCRTETTPVPLDFNAALRGRISTFLTWDTGAPAGYIGDNTTPHKVVGSPTDFNKVRVQGPGFSGTCTNADGTTVNGCQETDLFIVQGKVQPGPSASTSANALDFGNVTAPVTKTIKYTSTGSEPVSVTGVTTDGAAFSTAEDCTTAAGGIAPGTSCSIGVTYTPVAGTSTGTVTIADSTGSPSRTINLRGSSVGVATQDVTSLAFGTQKAGTTSASEVVVVGNSGVAPVAVSAPTIAGAGAAHFKVASNGCATVAPGAGCEVAVAFAPTTNGAKTATLTIPTNGGNLTVPLSGTGATPVVTMSATSLAFADQAAGTTSTPRAVTLTNGGTAALSIDDVAVPAQFQQIGGTCTVGANVTPGSSCNVTVAFAPTTAGAKSGTLAISADGTVNNVALSGTGVAPPDGVAPTAPTALKATVVGGSQVDLTWTAATDNVGVTRYDVTRDGVVVGSSTTTSFSDTGLAELSSHTYSVKALDGAGNASAASASATAKTADVTAPSIPAGVAATATGTSTINLGWTASTDNVGVTGYRVYRDGAATAVGSPTTTSFTDTGLAAGSAHSYTVAAIDAAGNLTAKSAPASATTAAAPADPVPTVTATSPANAATSVAVGNNVTATFSEAVQGVSTTTFTLRANGSTTNIAGTVTQNGTTNQWILNPSANLASNTQYTATLTGGTGAIRDSANQPLTATSWTFTTAAAATDTTAPSISARTPGVNGTGFSQTGNITATFSEAVTGVSATTFTLKNAATGAAVGATSVAYNTTSRVATFDPNVTLAADTKYTASLTTAIKDAAGNALPATSWTFTTGPVPTVSSRTPGTNGTGFAAANNITATFNENVTGVSGITFTLKNTSTGAAQAAVVSYNTTTRVATLNPNVNLANDTKYTASLTTAIKDAGGNPIAATSWTFTTGPVPTVTARTPASGATGVSRTANVTATFSEAVTGWTTTTATVKNAATGVVQTAVVSYNATSRVVTINPSATLAASTKFTVTLSNGIKDTIGNPIAATTWSFTTGA